MEWEAPLTIHWIPIAFNDIHLVFSYYESVFIKRDYAFIVTQFSNWNYTGAEGGEDLCMFYLS